jgi:L-serine dehydratase
MTCDPIGGYVQIPCIERNAMGAIKAYNAYLLSASGNASAQKISLDSVIKVMRATGRDMSKKYKETSQAGLALSATEC